MPAKSRILLGVCGSIAAYKACEVVSYLVKQGHDVFVIMTTSAQEFVSPLTFASLSGNPVITSLFDQKEKYAHLNLTKDAALMVVVPATANIIGKFANGIADDALSAVFLTAKCPTVVAPAMNEKMFLDKNNQENLEKLAAEGVSIVAPAEGFLACGESGLGRLAEKNEIIRIIESFLDTNKLLRGKKVLVTAGPTREYIDDIRFISNRSSGKMGYALAAACCSYGADVTLVSGPVNLTRPYGVRLKSVETGEEMLHECRKYFPESDLVIMSAAVADFRPTARKAGKLKKSDKMTLELEKTADILTESGKFKKKNHYLVGFAAESEELAKNALHKLDNKQLDLIVGNLISDSFGKDTNRVVLFFSDGRRVEIPVMPKAALSFKLVGLISEEMKKPGKNN